MVNFVVELVKPFWILVMCVFTLLGACAVYQYILRRLKPVGPSTTGYTVYGTNWCGYTTKQKKYLAQTYGPTSYTYVDCDTHKTICKDITSYPQTTLPNGDTVRGYNNTI